MVLTWLVSFGTDALGGALADALVQVMTWITGYAATWPAGCLAAGALNGALATCLVFWHLRNMF